MFYFDGKKNKNSLDGNGKHYIFAPLLKESTKNKLKLNLNTSLLSSVG